MGTATENLNFDAATKQNVDQWLKGNYDKKTKLNLQKMLNDNPQEVMDAFYTSLSFGTGGMRGVTGIGTNRFNGYTVRAATQGLANYINKQPKKREPHGVAIGYDSRNESRYFAEEAAKVLAGNGIKVYLYKELRPTPLVSFACRHFKCISGIVITASHNPPEYNGYKVYWDDGAQILPPHDQGIIDEVRRITDLSQVKMGELDNLLIQVIGEEVDNAYLKAIDALQFYPKENKAKGNQLKVVYTSLHGTGMTMIPKALRQWGFSSLLFVKEQEQPDGNFPTVKSPNPEERAALAMGIDLLNKSGSDLLIATDPDVDRMGIAVKHGGETVLLTGNEIACVCLEHICKALKDQKRMPAKAAFVKTIVTSELFRAIAEAYGATCIDVLTGFKYIAEKIKLWEGQKEGFDFVFGGEESYGYLLGTVVRDKDAVIASALICEVALHAKLHGKTIVDLLNDLYMKYGIYKEKLLSIKYEETKAGREKMKKAMVNLRRNPPQEVNGVRIVSIDDYEKGLDSFPKSDVLVFWMEDGSSVVVRPSGTEPKVKLYGSGKLSGARDIASGVKACEERVSAYLIAFKGLLGT